MKKKSLIIISICITLIICIVVSYIKSKNVDTDKKLFFEFAHVHDNIAKRIEETNNLLTINTDECKLAFDKAQEIFIEFEECMKDKVSNDKFQTEMWYKIMKMRNRDLKLLMEAESKYDEYSYADQISVDGYLGGNNYMLAEELR